MCCVPYLQAAMDTGDTALRTYKSVKNNFICILYFSIFVHTFWCLCNIPFEKTPPCRCLKCVGGLRHLYRNKST